LLYFRNQSTPNSSSVIQRQLANDGAKRNLRSLHIHFVENFSDLTRLLDYQHNDCVCTLISDDLGVTTVTAFGAVSTGCVDNSSECSVVLPLAVLV